MGSVSAAFLTSYTLFEVPSAWYGDRFGPRKGLLWIVSAWLDMNEVSVDEPELI